MRYHEYHYKWVNDISDVILKAAFSKGLFTYKNKLEESIANFQYILSSSDLEAFLSDEEPDEEVETDISDDEELFEVLEHWIKTRIQSCSWQYAKINTRLYL